MHITLYNMHMKGGTYVQNLGLWMYPGRVTDQEKLASVLSSMRECGFALYTLPDLATALPDVPVLSEEDFFYTVEAVAALGGDGTVLGAARACAPHQVPVFGINLGHKGFLAGTEFEGLSNALLCLKEDRFQTESRLMLQAGVLPFCKEKAAFAVNDMLICSKEPMTMIRTGAAANGLEVGDFDSDGLLVSTPTGSTGYNLSAGGPVIGPGADVILLTPLHAHSMRSVPLVLSPDTELVLSYKGRGKGLLIADGRAVGELSEGEEVCVSRAPFPALLIQMDPEQFYKVLYAKLK